MIRSDLNFDNFYKERVARLQKLFADYLTDIPSLELKMALEYTLLNGGKRLRPMLVYAAGDLFGAPLDLLDGPACAVEMLHTYSLIHDDLPCMDNSDLRRGKASCHKSFSEGMAILAGDGLNTLAMQVITDYPASISKERRLQILSVLGKATGPFGMVAGQALDISVLSDTSISTDLLTDIYYLKTGALISACLETGRLASKDDDEVNQRALKTFGDRIGLAFQIQDDLLDIEMETKNLGKPQGLDSRNKKITYPQLFGVQKAYAKVETLYEEALEAINYFGSKAFYLRKLTNDMLKRTS